MPISVDVGGSSEETAHRAWLIPSSESVFREQRRLFLFLTQLEYVQKMFAVVKEHCWAAPWFSWLAAWSISVIFPSTCPCAAILQHCGQRLPRLGGTSVLVCYQLHSPFPRTIHLLLVLLIGSTMGVTTRAKEGCAALRLSITAVSSIYPELCMFVYSLTQKSVEESTWDLLVNSNVKTHLLTYAYSFSVEDFQKNHVFVLATYPWNSLF